MTAIALNKLSIIPNAFGISVVSKRGTFFPCLSNFSLINSDS